MTNTAKLLRRLPAFAALLAVVVGALPFGSYRVSGDEPATSKPNVLLICIDDLRPELKCFGAEYIHSPRIDALAKSGRAFHRHYVQAPTCGASRYTLLTGQYGPADNGALFQRVKKISHPSLPAWFKQHGYQTVSVGKVSHHPGGRGGEDWDDDSLIEMPNSWGTHLMPCGPWQHPRGAMHGLANGEIRVQPSKMGVFQAFDGPDTAYPDGLITETSIKQLEQLAEVANEKPFFLAVGLIRPHLPLGAPAKYLRLYDDVQLPPIPHPGKPIGKTTWHGSGEFNRYNRWNRNPNTDSEFATLVRKHYAACVSYVDAQVAQILQALDDSGKRNNTIVILWGDHGWHLGEHAIWGKHALFEESLRSPLIISYAGIPNAGVPSQATIETLDLFPTICELTDLPVPDFVDGVSLKPILDNPTAAGHPAISYTGGAKTIRTSTHRLIAHKDGHLELYDHTSPVAETKNIADEQRELAADLLQRLNTRLKR